MAAPDPMQDIPKLVRVITHTCLGLLFLSVFFLSLFVAGDVTGDAIYASFVKALLATGLAWVFLLVVSDAVVRSIVASAIESKATRRDGGLLYHFLPPDPDEISDDGAEAKKT